MGESTKDQNNRKGFHSRSGSYFWKNDQCLQGPGSRGRVSEGWGPRLLELLYKDTGRTTVGQKYIKIVILALIITYFYKSPPFPFYRTGGRHRGLHSSNDQTSEQQR